MIFLRTLLATTWIVAALTQAATASAVTLARAASGHLPSSAMPAGHDAEGRALYSCTAVHDGQYQPGRLGPGDTGCRIAFRGEVVPVENYLVLTGMGSVWAAPARGEALPQGAFVAGGTRSAPPYACRGYAARGLYPGRIGAETGWLCVFAVDGREMASGDFDVLLR